LLALKYDGMIHDNEFNEIRSELQKLVIDAIKSGEFKEGKVFTASGKSFTVVQFYE